MLRLFEVSKIYRRNHTTVTALHDISLEIREGEFVALMGPSGSGKSTLLHLLGGLDQPTHGSIFFRNQNLAKMNDRELSRIRNLHIGFVFQDALLLPHLTVEENVRLPLAMANFVYSIKSSSLDELINYVGLERRTHHKPPELSGGEAARACIARALIMNPELVLADEPTGNLDSKTGAEIIKLFQKLHKETNATFIIATHDAKIAGAAQRIIHLENGLTKI